MQTVAMNRTAPCLAASPATAAAKRTATVASPARQMNTLRMSAKFAPRVAARASALVVRAGAEDIPTVAETKAAFMDAYSKPIPAMFNTILQELLVSQHLYVNNAKYKYNALCSLGFISVFDQIFTEDFKWGKSEDIFTAYNKALGLDPSKCRADSDKLIADAKASSSAAALAELSAVKELADQKAAGKLLHNKFLAIGLFRVLEVGGYTDPEALKSLIAASGLSGDDVNRDLLQYKSLLSKLEAAKEMQKEFIKRERKKTAEREAAKAAKASTPA